jgi:hypothetical protein
MPIHHEPEDPYCKHYESSRHWLASLFSLPRRLLLGQICNECRTLGREHARG